MPERLILFSQPSLVVFEKLKTTLFPEFLTEKVFAYMPSDGSNQEANIKYNPVWQQFAENNGAKFVFIDNSKRGSEVQREREKIQSANILLISGGNTFKLLDQLRQSGLDEAVVEFWQREGVVLAGFSAGAIVLSPRIDIALQPSGTDTTDLTDENTVGITDLTGLNLVDFEVWPHYYPEIDKATLENYQKNCPSSIRTLGDEELLVIDK